MTLANKALFTAQASNASSPWYVVQGGAGQDWHASLGGVNGTFGGGNVTMEVSPDGGTTVFPIGVLSVPGCIQAQLPPGISVRFTLAGATAPSINANFME